MTLLAFRCERVRVCWRLLNLCECATLMHIPDWYISMETCSTLYKPVAKEWALARFFFPFLYHFFPSLTLSLSYTHTHTLVLLQQRDPEIALELSQCNYALPLWWGLRGEKVWGLCGASAGLEGETGRDTERGRGRGRQRVLAPLFYVFGSVIWRRATRWMRFPESGRRFILEVQFIFIGTLVA